VEKDVKLPNVSIQIISFPPAISYTVNISALMYTQQQVGFCKKITLMCHPELSDLWQNHDIPFRNVLPSKY